MTRKTTTSSDKKPIALAALKRAAKEAFKLAVRTKTPLWVMEGNEIVDATKSTHKSKKKRRPKNNPLQPSGR